MDDKKITFRPDNEGLSDDERLPDPPRKSEDEDKGTAEPEHLLGDDDERTEQLEEGDVGTKLKLNLGKGKPELPADPPQPSPFPSGRDAPPGIGFPDTVGSPADSEESYGDLAYGREPNKFVVGGQRPSAPAASPARPSVRGEPRPSTQRPASQGETRTRRRRRRKRSARRAKRFPFITLLILAGLGIFAYKHRHSAKVLIEKLRPSQSSSKSGLDDSITATRPVITDRGENRARYESLAEMGCDKMLTKVGVIKNIGALPTTERLAIAECYYLSAEYADSLKILISFGRELKGEALLLHTILLLKMRQFGRVSDTLQGKCVSRSRDEDAVLACLASSLHRFAMSGRVYRSTKLRQTKNESQYKAIAWFLNAVHQQRFSPRSLNITQAVAIAKNTKRPVALAFIYEMLMREVYARGMRDVARELAGEAEKYLVAFPESKWWVSFLNRLLITEDKKNMTMQLLSISGNVERIVNDLYYLNIAGYEGILHGYNDTLEALVRKARSFHKRASKLGGKEGLQFVGRWDVRTKIAGSRYHLARKSLETYVANHGKDHFYHFYRGVVMTKLRGTKGGSKVMKQFELSMNLKDSWEANYCFASTVFATGQYKKFDRHLVKLRRMATNKKRKYWLYLLETKAEIESPADVTLIIAKLRRHISEHPRAFAAYRLLIAAYNRVEQDEKATLVRNQHDRLQKTVPYYTTFEGLNDPFGPFALMGKI